MADDTSAAETPTLNPVEDFPYAAMPFPFANLAQTEDVQALQPQEGANSTSVQRYEP